MDSVFLFEAAVCGAIPDLPPSVTVEGLGMFKTLYDGFVKAGVEPSIFVGEGIPYFPGTPKAEAAVDEQFDKYLSESGQALVIAPETGMMLYDMTRKVERAGVVNMGSSSGGVETTTDKYLTYKTLGDLMPQTEVWDKRTSLDFPLVAKPRDGVSGEGIFMVEDETGLEKVQRGYLVQEHVPGQAMSASVIAGDDVTILSINTQEMNGFEYGGAVVPGGLEEERENIIRSVETVKGLFGYIGVDFVKTDNGTKIIEINPRPTTPIVVLEEVYGVNLSEIIIMNYYRESLPVVKARKQIRLSKAQGSDGFVTYGGYTLKMEAI